MKTVEEIWKILTNYKDELRESFKVEEIGIFGSYERHQQIETSDIDILVKFEEPIGLLSFIGLKNYLFDLRR